jgi:hypothetical protein
LLHLAAFGLGHMNQIPVNNSSSAPPPASVMDCVTTASNHKILSITFSAPFRFRFAQKNKILSGQVHVFTLSRDTCTVGASYRLIILKKSDHDPLIYHPLRTHVYSRLDQRLHTHTSISKHEHRQTHALQHSCCKHTHTHGTNKHAQYTHYTQTERHRHTPGHTPTPTRIYLPRLALVAGLVGVREVGQLGVEAKDRAHEILVGYARLGQPSGIVGIVHGNGIHCQIPPKTLVFAADFIPQQSAELYVISHNLQNCM